jgi:transposase
MKIPAKFKEAPEQVYQNQLFPPNIFDLLPDDHDCHLYSDLLDQLDTSEIEEQYSHLGQRGFHPRHITSILIYAYSHGVFSSREIEKKCSQDLAFMFIAKMHCPNFRVLSDFRKDHGDFFRSCFKQTVQLAVDLKLASFGHISLDGSKFKAKTSKHKAMSYKRMKEQEAKLTKEISALIKKATTCDAEEDEAYKEETGYSIPEDLAHKEKRLEKIQEAKQALEEREKAANPEKPIDDKAQISFADHDAAIMGSKQKGFGYGYNPQVSVDMDNQIIVGQHVSQAANDIHEVEAAIEQLEGVVDINEIDVMTLDNGYCSGSNLAALEDAGVDAYVSVGKERKQKEENPDPEGKFVKADFRYDAEADCFVCPAGEILARDLQSKAKTNRYKIDREKCAGCVYKERCHNDKKRNFREIQTDNFEKHRQAMQAKMQTREAKEIYSKRKAIVEPVFGQIKNSGFKGFSVRSKKKVEGEFSLVCAAHNVKKMITAMFKGLVRPDEANCSKYEQKAA